MAGKDDLMKIITSNPEVFKAYLNGGSEFAENLLKHEDEIIQAGKAIGADELIDIMQGGKAAINSADEVVEAGVKAAADSTDEVVEAGAKAASSSDEVVEAGVKAAGSTDEIVETGAKAVTSSSDEVVEAGTRAVVNGGSEAAESGGKALTEGTEDTSKILDDLDEEKVKKLSNMQKGNYGEIVMDNSFAEKGYERISLDRVTSLDDATHHGIDGVYFNPDGEPQYIIAEAKYGTSQLSKVVDGKQMDHEWIAYRLEASVGEEMAEKIKLEALINPENVQSILVKIKPDGNITTNLLDDAAKIIKNK